MENAVPTKDELLEGNSGQREDKDELTVQLAELNEWLARRSKIRKIIINTIIIIVFVCMIAAIYPRWNEIWYDFGRNWYHWLHG